MTALLPPNNGSGPKESWWLNWSRNLLTEAFVPDPAFCYSAKRTVGQPAERWGQVSRPRRKGHVPHRQVIHQSREGRIDPPPTVHPRPHPHPSSVQRVICDLPLPELPLLFIPARFQMDEHEWRWSWGLQSDELSLQEIALFWAYFWRKGGNENGL